MPLHPKDIDGANIAIFIWDHEGQCGGSAVLFGTAGYANGEFTVIRDREPFLFPIPESAWPNLRLNPEPGPDNFFGTAEYVVMLRLGPLPEGGSTETYQKINIPILKSPNDGKPPAMELKPYLAARAKEVDAALDRFLPKKTTSPATIHAAMRYTVFAGGKRLRPILCLAAAEACGGALENALAPASAVEVLHTYSLVHDDLPCMDDDDLRRGRPTCHKVYGEGMAVLTGDALLTEAFLMLSQTPATKRYGVREYVSELALTGGSRHLIGGQVLDLEGEGQKPSKARLIKIHEAKTAALLTSSLRLGAMTANATPKQLAALTVFGHALGLAFQVIDDILDVTQSTEVLGKTAGKDAAVDKTTYPALFGLEKSRKEAARLTKESLDALKPFGKKGQRLSEIAHYLLDREY